MRGIEVLTLKSRRSYGGRRAQRPATYRRTSVDFDRQPLRGRRNHGGSETAGQGGRAPAPANERCDRRVSRHAEPRRLGRLYRQRHHVAQDDPRRPRVGAESEEPDDPAADDVEEGDREAGEGLTACPAEGRVTDWAAA